MGHAPQRAGLLRTSLILLVTALAASCTNGASDEPGPPPPGDRFNIVFILTDDQTADSMPLMTYTNRRKDWIRFDRAFLNFPLCCPSRATILTGRYSHRLGIEDNNSGNKLDETSTIATSLKQAGYRTGLIGKYLNRYPFGRGLYVPPGWDDWASFRLDFSYYNYRLVENGDQGEYGDDAEEYSTDLLAKRAVSFIESSGRRPFFLWVGFNAPHVADRDTPAIPAPRHRDASVVRKTRPNFDERDVADKPSFIRALPRVSRRVMETSRREEGRALLAVDDAVRLIFETLTRRGILDRTVVVYMSDNGFSWGEHRFVGKSCQYEECIVTPLLIRYPGISGRRLGDLISNVDIAPTFAAIAGARLGPPVDGMSFLPLVRGQTTMWRSAVLIRGFAPQVGIDFWGVRTVEHKYVEHASGDRELYDLRADPFELSNVAEKEPSLVGRLAETLRSLRAL